MCPLLLFVDMEKENYRPVHPDDHLQEVGPSGWSFARGQSNLMITCKRPFHSDDHLQEGGQFVVVCCCVCLLFISVCPLLLFAEMENVDFIWSRKIYSCRGKKTGKENEEFNWRKICFFLWRRKLAAMEKKEIFGERKYFEVKKNREEEDGKYLEMYWCIYLAEVKKTEKEREDHLQEASPSGWSF